MQVLEKEKKLLRFLNDYKFNFDPSFLFFFFANSKMHINYYSLCNKFRIFLLECNCNNYYP